MYAKVVKDVYKRQLYTYSNRTQEAFAQSGICRNTVPLELNYKELRHIDCSNSELLIYGYPVSYTHLDV